MDLANATDEHLLAASAAGDLAAFTALARRHQATVAAVAFAIVRDRELAFDLTQDAFVRAWRRLGEVRDPTRLGAWLCGIVRFLARDHRRRDRRRAALGAAAPLGSSAPTPLDLALDGETARLLAAGVAALPERYREPLLLHHVAGRSVAELAALLGVSEEAARQRLSRARQALRTSLAQLDSDEPRFAQAALALIPPVGFAEATAATTTRSAPTTTAIAPTTTMPRSMARASAAVLAVAAVGGLGLAIARPGATSVPSAPPPSPATVASAAAAGPHPVAAPTTRAPGPGPAAAALTSADRPRAVATPTTSADDEPAPPPLIYDFAGEVLDLDAPPPAPAEPTSPPPANVKARLRAALAALRPAVWACARAARERDADLAGTYVVAFDLAFEAELAVVADAPTVTAPDGGPPLDEELAACLADVAASVTVVVDGATTPVRVVYPYVLGR